MGAAKLDKYVGSDVSKNTLDLMVRPTGAWAIVARARRAGDEPDSQS